MVLNEKIFNLLSNKRDEMFEGKPMEKLSKNKQLIGYKHKGFCSAWIL